MTASLYERLGSADGIARIVGAMGQQSLDDATKNEVVAILYSLKGNIIRV